MQDRKTQSWTRPDSRTERTHADPRPLGEPQRALSLSAADGSVTLSWSLYAQLMGEAGWTLDDPASAPADLLERSSPHPLSLKALYLDGEPQPEDGGR